MRDFLLSQLIRYNDELVAVRRTLEEPSTTLSSDQRAIGNGSSNPVMLIQTFLEIEEKLLEKRSYIECHLSYCVEIIKSCDKPVQPMTYTKCTKDTKDVRISESHNYFRIRIYYLIDENLRQSIKN